jgi:hypothetical protein
MAQYNGHRSWNAWNVSLWLNNDERLYYLMLDCIKETKNRRRAAQKMLSYLPAKTPDGARYNVTCIMEAMRGL